MIQRQRPHLAGTFPPCAGCGREPKHYEIHGYSTRDAGSVRDEDGTGHMLECYPCNARTPIGESLDAARAAWTLNFAAEPSRTRSNTASPTHLRAIK